MKVLIIKTGHTETFDLHPAHTHIVSLGDVARTTVILNHFKNDEVFWFTSEEALPFFDYIKSPVTAITSFEDIKTATFDFIINLERSEIFYLLKPHAGFVSNGTLIINGELFKLEDWLSQAGIKESSWNHKLFQILGGEWNKQTATFAVTEKMKSRKKRIGLNWQVGKKWPGKSWPLQNWQDLHDKLADDFEMSWQEGFNDIRMYIEWIQSCDYVITHDSLGLHLCLLLNKPFIALFGPTAAHEIDLQNLGQTLMIPGLHVDSIVDKTREWLND